MTTVARLRAMDRARERYAVREKQSKELNVSKKRETEMKRYILFIGDYYYPNRWGDFVGDFDTIEEARVKAYSEKDNEYHQNGYGQWYQIIDTETKTICEEG